MLEQRQYLQLRFYNNSTLSTSNLQINFKAEKWQQDCFQRDDLMRQLKQQRERKTWIYPYWMTLDSPTSFSAPVTIPANGSATGTMSNTGDNFLAMFDVIASGLTTGVAGDTTELYTVEIFDAKTNRALMSGPVTSTTLGGTAGFSFGLPTPIIIEPKTNLVFKFVNLVTDQATDAQITLKGVAIEHYRGGVFDKNMRNVAAQIYRGQP